MSRVLYFDCFSGISGDMVLGALLDAGLPLDELKRRARQPGGLRATTITRRARAAGAASRPRSSRRRTSTATPHEHARARALATPRTLTHERTASPSRASEPAGDLRAHRHVGAVGRRTRPGEGAVSAAGRGRGGDSPDAGRAGAPARGRRARLDHRHRRRRVRARVGWRRSDRLLAAQRRRRHGASRRTGVFPVPAPATVKLLGERADLRRRGPEGAGHADRRADRDGVRRRRSARFRPMTIERVGYGAGDRDDPGHAERPARAHRPRRPTAAERRARRRVDRVRDRRHEPADLRRRHGSAVRGRRARGVLRAGADEEEPAGHAADGRLRRRAAGGARPTSSSARRRRSGCGTPRSSASACEREIVERRDAGRRGPVQAGLARRPRRQRRAGVRRLRDDWRRPHSLSVKDVQAIAVQAYGAVRGPATREPLLPHDRDRLRQQPAASRHGVREDLRPTSSPATSGCCGIDTRFLMGNDEHSQNVFKKAVEEGLDPLAYCDRMEQEFRASVAGARHLVRRLHPDDRAAAQGRRHRDRRAAPRRRRHLRGRVRRLVLRRLREPSSRRRTSSTAAVRCTRRSTPQWIREKNYFFRLSKYQQPLLRSLRGPSGVPPARDPPQRDPAAARERARGHLGQPGRAVLGHSAAVRSVERRVRLVRRADQLRVGGRPRRRPGDASTRGGRPICT